MSPRHHCVIVKLLEILTLTYGLELCNLSTYELLKKLDIHGRNALKSLFNIFKHSKNHLNYILQIDHISTIIIRNKLNLCCRLLKNNFTRQIIFNMMEKKIEFESKFINNIIHITAEIDFDFYAPTIIG